MHVLFFSSSKPNQSYTWNESKFISYSVKIFCNEEWVNKGSKKKKYIIPLYEKKKKSRIFHSLKNSKPIHTGKKIIYH